MKKLNIRNFGPIAKADIDLKRINVFIGPQGSGKSTIAKIISAFKNYNKSKSDWAGYEFKAMLGEEYGLAGFFEKNTSIRITTANDSVLDINDPEEHMMIHEPGERYYIIPRSIYIPAERVIIPLIAEHSFLFISEKISIQKYITEFGILFQNARKNIKEQTISFLDDVTYFYDDNTDKVKLKNGKTIRLSESSNGIQSTLPLILAISFLADRANKKNDSKDIAISIEEPELSLFPSTQSELLRVILEKLLPLNYHLTITTHSPYTLTTLNNLIYAYQVGQNNDGVKAIVSDNLWLNPNDVGAWYVENGTVRSIIDEENMQIKAQEIDHISDVLNQEYDQIMDVKFAQREK
jgi:predicted ATPase